MTNRIVLITLESAHFGERFSFLSLLEDVGLYKIVVEMKNRGEFRYHENGVFHAGL